MTQQIQFQHLRGGDIFSRRNGEVMMVVLANTATSAEMKTYGADISTGRLYTLKPDEVVEIIMRTKEVKV